MKIVKTAAGKKTLKISRSEWHTLGHKAGWLTKENCATCGCQAEEEIVESKKGKSPKEHGFIQECMEKNKDKDNPGAYCASIVDKVKGTTKWRKGPKKD